jgi:pSer/pThr/pTyr-binding forkhead associated (FHA) protein
MAVDTDSSAAVNESISTPPSTPGETTDTLLTLEVTRGHTLYPHRPVTTSRYLIGSGVGCHLRLGGPDLPTLHSLIVVDGKQVLLESIAIEPPLVVNGRRVGSVALSHGDRIEIGPFHFTARMIPPQAAIPTDVQRLTEEPIEIAAAVEDLSALELVDRLENELQSVDEFESRCELGAGALIESVRQRQAESEIGALREVSQASDKPTWRIDKCGVPAPHFKTMRPAEPEGRRDDVFVDDLRRLHDDLQRFSRLLEARAEQLSQQEASVADAAAELVEDQQRLTQQLATLLSQTSSQADSLPIAGTTIRASA